MHIFIHTYMHDYIIQAGPNYSIDQGQRENGYNRYAYSIKSLPSPSQNVALLHPNTLINSPSEISIVYVITDIRRNSSHLGSCLTIYIWPVHHRNTQGNEAAVILYEPQGVHKIELQWYGSRSAKAQAGFKLSKDSFVDQT